MKDIMDTAAPAPRKAITILEVNDKGREHEYTRYRSYRGWPEYVKLFVSFLESLGYDVEQSYPGNTTVTIEGLHFNIDTDHASFMSRNAWKREVIQRKPENRYIRFCGMRFHFNKELDTERIKTKIAEAIQKDKQQKEDNEKYKQLQIDNCNAVGQHFYKNPVLKLNVEQLNIHQGEITLYLNYNIGTIRLKSDGSFKQAQYRPMEINSINELNIYTNNVPYHTEVIRKCVIELVNYIQKLPAHLTEWIDKTYHNYFDFKTGKPKK